MTLTIFTTCRPFDDAFADIQTNAIRSWSLLKPWPEIILIGDEMGTAEAAAAIGCQHVRAVTRNQWGVPLLSSLFWTALTCGKGDVFCYINSDIIMLPDFMKAVDAAAHRFDVFLMVGPRWDLDVGRIDFESAWEGDLRRSLGKHGVRHKPTGLDYFVFTRGTYTADSFPPLAVGQTAWDAWLVWKAWHKGIPTIDATQAVTAIHQNHEKGGKSMQKKVNRAMANADRLGHGYVWESKCRVIPGDKYRVVDAEQPISYWAKDVGWGGSWA